MKKNKKNKGFINTGLFWCLVFFSVLLVGLASVSIHFFTKMDDIYKVTTSISALYKQYNQASLKESTFFKKEIYLSELYKSGKSKNFILFKQKINWMKDTILNLKSSDSYKDFEIGGEMSAIEDGLENYQKLFEASVNKTLKKGYKDFGLEGKMRGFVHELEEKSAKLGVDKVLMLRRHEKDYLLRNEDVYIGKLASTINELKSEIIKNDDLTVREKDELIVLLYNYFESFNALVHVGKEIGHREEQGLNEMLETRKANLEIHFERLQNKASDQEHKLTSVLQKTYLVIALNLLAITVLLIFLFFKYRKNNDDESNFNSNANSEPVLNVAHKNLKQAL